MYSDIFKKENILKLPLLSTPSSEITPYVRTEFYNEAKTLPTHCYKIIKEVFRLRVAEYEAFLCRCLLTCCAFQF